MRRQWQISKTLCVALVAFGVHVAWSQPVAISGRVMSGQENLPLAGVRIEAETGGPWVVLMNATPSDGRFSLDPGSKLLTADLHVGVTLRFSADGYKQQIRIVSETRRELGDIGLVPTNNLLGPDPGVLGSPSADGRTVFLVPFLGGLQPGVAADPNIAQRLQRNINTHLQSLVPAGPPNEVPVQLMQLPTGAGGGRLRANAVSLNALAVVSGQVAVSTTAGHSNYLKISSEFEIIPSLPNFVPNTLWVDDEVSADELHSGRLSTLFNSPSWGYSATLAVSILEIKRAIASSDRLGLERARRYLIAERAEQGPRAKSVVDQINRLLAAIDAERAQ